MNFVGMSGYESCYITQGQKQSNCVVGALPPEVRGRTEWGSDDSVMKLSKESEK